MTFLMILPLLMLGLVVDGAIYYRVRASRLKHKSWWRSAAVLNILLGVCWILAMWLWPKKDVAESVLRGLMWSTYLYLSVYASKLVYVLGMGISRIPRLFNKKAWRWVEFLSAFLGVSVFGLMMWGAFINRFNIEIHEESVEIPNLPSNFEGFKIVQISDLHLGTYGTDTTYVSRLVDSVNTLRPDLIVFTGDIANRHSKELLPFLSSLSRLHATYGVYSILGNHDYGEYYHWKSAQAKADNIQLMKDLQTKMGWKMLNNSCAELEKGGQTMHLIGVENIGDPPFPTYGSLEQAYPKNLASDTLKILLSHNPVHWGNDIRDKHTNIALTLSGHTHAMQIELLGFSPAMWRYKLWGGMYVDGHGQHLYVNRGIGSVALPMRIGATPEITLFTLVR